MPDPVIDPTPVGPAPDAPTPAPAPAPAGSTLAQIIAAAIGLLIPGAAPWISIVTNMLTGFMGCLPSPTPAAARQNASDHYHNGGYDRGTILIAQKHAMRAARKAGSPITKEDAHTAAIQTLDGIRTADDPTLAAAIAQPEIQAAMAAAG